MLQTIAESAPEPDLWHYVILVAGALGAWLLFAGPIYQAALELREEGFDREAFEATTAGVAEPARVSGWWWLLPPVAFVKQQRRSREYRDAVMGALGPTELEQSVNFLNKANGWLIVALGGFLIAAKETYEVVELFELSLWWFWILTAIMTVLALAHLGLRMSQSAKLLGQPQQSGRTGRPRRRRPQPR